MSAAFSSFAVSCFFSSVSCASVSVCFLRSAFCFVSPSMFFWSSAPFSPADFSVSASWAFLSSSDFILTSALSRAAFASALSAARLFASLRVSASCAFFPSSSEKHFFSASNSSFSFIRATFSVERRLFSSSAAAAFSAVEVSAVTFFKRSSRCAAVLPSSSIMSRTESTQASSLTSGLFGMSLQYSLILRSASAAWRFIASVSFVRRLYVFPQIVTVTFSLSIAEVLLSLFSCPKGVVLSIFYFQTSFVHTIPAI